MSRYLVRLKPLGEFFFGGEKSFADNNWNRSEDNETYIIKSRQFPQQTAILGMLRKEILKQDKEFEIKDFSEYEQEDWNRMTELIGEESFNLAKSDQSFGKIMKISPLLLCKDKQSEEDDMDFYIKVPKDHNKYTKEKDKKNYNEKYTPFELDTKSIITSFGKIRPFASEQYDSKKWVYDGFMNLKTKKLREYETSEDKDNRIFIPFERVGIEKEGDKEAFYKQVFYKLADGFEFAFFAEIDFELRDSIVELGKERSTFKMSVEETDKNYNKLVKGLNNDEHKIILLSDCFIDEELKGIEFAIKSGISFRNLETSKEKGRVIRKNIKYNFWERGSVLYVREGKRDEVINKIKAKENLVKIGYNEVI